MQSKGIIKWLAVLLGIASIWQLSFTFVTRHVEAEAAKQENPQAYLDEMWDKSVYVGYTYGECKEKELNLGLDLKGGMNVMLEIKAEDVIRTNAFNDITVAANNLLRDAIESALRVASKMESPSAVVDTYVANLSAEDRMAIYGTEDAATIAKELNDHIVGSVSKMNEVLATRIDLLGVVQPNIQPIAGTNRIMVELPGVKEPERVSKLLASTANLEFWQVCQAEDVNTVMETLFVNADAVVRDYLLAQGEDEAEVSLTPLSELLMTSYPAMGADGSTMTFNVGEPIVAAADKSNIQLINEYLSLEGVDALIPADVKLAWSNKSSLDSSKGVFLLYALKGKDGAMLPVLDGSGITSARAQGGQYGGFEVSMTMDSKTAIEWGNITGANVGRSIAIVLDSYVYSAPRVNGRIDGGSSSITGNFSAQEAEDLANVLSSGKSPAPATIIYSEVVGPSLGQQSISAGLISFALAFCLVLLYMAFFYNRAGWYANVALICNVLLLFGVLVSFGAVLTLPGIAGIVLTMGMAVDANVIIFERIKEELRGGKGLALAIKDGFSNAYSAIIDGNLTTIITGIVLFYFGTGPVKGFATTLVVGIITSLFCAIFITRLLIETRVERKGELKFSSKLTENFLQNVKFSFISKRKVSYLVSGILVIASIISLLTIGLNQGVEFTGGRSYVVKFNESVNIENVRQSIEETFESVADAANSSIEVKQFGADNQIRVVTQYQPEGLEGEEANDAVDRLLFQALDEYFTIDEFGFDEFRTAGDGIAQWGIASSEQVSESISSEMTVNSIIAVLIALVAIGIYIAIRFRRWQWALGATVALAHNALLVIGIFSMLYAVMPFNLEVNQAFIAAILTIIGYSINDTVVIFDRIREYLGLYPKRDIKTNIDNAICATLSRTINTSGTTLVTL
ncbi:MAG: protein translocase subunit SecD, partial [Alistipes sp.]|nr:protein translocase subunit SecD [Alistipes sp.]